MIYTLPDRQPDTAYVDTWLWLPKSKVSVGVLKKSLVIPVTLRDGEMDYIRLWREGTHHIGVPRAKIPISSLDYPVVDLRPRSYESIDFGITSTLDSPGYHGQVAAYEDMVDAEGGILNMRCGGGKTVVMLHCIANWGVPTLIINDKTNILHQWKKEINLHLRHAGGVGWIQGPPKTWDWERPITLASLMTLARHAEEVPIDMSRYFGAVIWDEIHHLAATEFSKTADMFFGRRYGASATLERDDGSEMVYFWHVGNPTHVNLEQDLVPDVVFMRSPTTINMNSIEAYPQIHDKRGEIHTRKLAAYVSQQEQEIAFVREIIDEGVSRDRDILAITMSKDNADALHELYPGSGVLHGGVNPKERGPVLHSHKLTFATVDIAKEALNKKSLDVLIILTEFSSKNILQQAMGRIQRRLEGKKKPRVIVVWHVNIRPMYLMGKKLQSHFSKWAVEVEVR